MTEGTLKISQMDKGEALDGDEKIEMAQEGQPDSVHVTPEMILDFIRNKHMVINAVTSSRALLPTDIGKLLVATGSNDIKLTVNTGLPNYFWCRLKNKTNGKRLDVEGGTAVVTNPDLLYGVRLGGRAELQPNLGSNEFDLYGDLVPSATKALLLLFHGQSNATRREPKVSTTYPSNLKTFAGFGQASDRTDGGSVTNPIPNTGFETTAAFSEFGNDAEGLASGFAAVASSDYQEILTATPAIGARRYRDLMKGEGPYANLLRSFSYGKSFLLNSSDQIETLITWDQGEAEAVDTITQQQYVDVLTDLVYRFSKDYKFAQHDHANTNLKIMGVQICITAGEGWRNVQNAHLEKAIEGTGYYLAGPRYAYEYETDGTHITGLGKRLFAEYLAHRHQQIKSGSALPVYIVSAVRVGAVITLSYNTIIGNLVIDTTNVPETTTAFPDSKYGFECFVSSVGVSISTVTVSGTEAEITLSSDPAAQVEVRYAQMTWPGGLQSVSGTSSKLARGNIRDSGEYTALHDASSLHNWACHQTILTDV